MKPKSGYNLNQSPFYKLHSKKRLGTLLFKSQSKLKSFSNSDNMYYDFTRPNKNTGKIREISAPRQDLKEVQARVADLLHRLCPPDFLFSPVKGRSYVDNARHHLGSNSLRLLDISNFYPNCKEQKVFWFFRKKMRCSSDVASIMCNIVCYKGALPQGSPCSPILAYLVYIDMWTEIELIVSKSDCKLSVYVDDITISSMLVPERAVWEVKKALRKHGHVTNEKKEKSKFHSPAEVTGVIVDGCVLSPPNRQLQKLHLASNRLKKVNHRSDIGKALLGEIRGRKAQIGQVKSGVVNEI